MGIPLRSPVTGKAQAAPGTPASGWGELWFDLSSKHWKQIDDTGTVSDLVTGTGTTVNAVQATVDFGYRPGTLDDDTFNRTVSNGLGSADTGGSYTLVGTAANFQVAPSVATVNMPDTFAEQTGLLVGTTTTDMELTATIQTTDFPTDADCYLHFYVRGTGSNVSNCYFIEVLIQPGNSQTGVGIYKAVGGVNTALTANVIGISGASWANNQLIKVRFRAQGSTLQAKIWRAADSEPGSWTVSVTDGTYASGWAAWGGLMSTSASTSGAHYAISAFHVDNLSPVSGEDYNALVTVPATWVTATSKILCSVAAAATNEHDAEDAIVENIVAYPTNIVAGVSFDIHCYAPRGTWGRYLVNAIGV